MKLGLLHIIIAIASVTILFFINPIEQDVLYHNFSDQKLICGVSNFLNVISNLPFLLVGIYGLLKTKNNLALQIFFVGVALVAFGSGYYHLNPNNDTLIWDRLPMTIAFMALFSGFIQEFINKQTGKKLLIPLLIFGFFSIIYWVLQNDLKWYVLVQFYPIIVILLTLLLSKKSNDLKTPYWYLITFYVLAKLAEYFDYQIHNIVQVISGHSVKHIFAAVGIYLFVRKFKSQTI